MCSSGVEKAGVEKSKRLVSRSQKGWGRVVECRQGDSGIVKENGLILRAYHNSHVEEETLIKTINQRK